MTDQSDRKGAAQRRKRRQVGLLSAFTLVIWVSCLGVGGLNLLFGHVDPPAPTSRPATAPVTEIMNVDLKDDMVPDSPPPSPLLQSADVSGPVNDLADTAVLPAAAMASPAIALAIPIRGPVRLTSVKAAALTANLPKSRAGSVPPVTQRTTAPVQHISTEQWEGPHPDPEYPEQARRAGQQGTVGLRIYVDEAGRVTGVDIVSPSPWPILDQAARRTILREWSTAGGPRRCYELSYTFELY